MTTLGSRSQTTHEQRVTTPRRCAWCLRFWALGEWIDGRREQDDQLLPATTHTICEDCVEELRAKGLSI